jgi:hypothetical protein
MSGGNEPNNRVTTQQFHQSQLETIREIAATNTKIDALALTQSEERAAMEIRLLEKLDGVPLQIQTNKDEIEKIRKKSNYWNAGNTVGILIAGALSAIGINK